MKQSGEDGGHHVGFINQVVGGVSIGPAWGYNEETFKGRTIRAADVEGIHRMLYKLLYDRRQCRSCNHDILLVSRYQISPALRFAQIQPHKAEEQVANDGAQLN